MARAPLGIPGGASSSAASVAGPGPEIAGCVWADAPTAAVELHGERAQIDAVLYGVMNPVRACLVEKAAEFVLCDEIDLCDTDFHQKALAILRRGEADLVVGSKVMKGASDERPFVRRLGTRVIDGMLRVSLGFQGTDTHGLKTFRRQPLLPIVHRCIADKDIFASEFVIRARREGIAGTEIPVRVLEKRVPTIGLFRRVPNVMKNPGKLVWAIRIQG